MKVSRERQEKRKQRELNCQLLAIGAMLSLPTEHCESLLPKQMIDSAIGGVVESLQGLVKNSSDRIKRDVICSWLESNCGIKTQEKEKFVDAVFRTAVENCRRREAESLTYKMYQLSLDPTLGDEAYIADLKKRVNEL